jgi:hypothetical protein
LDEQRQQDSLDRHGEFPLRTQGKLAVRGGECNRITYYRNRTLIAVSPSAIAAVSQAPPANSKSR